MSRQIMNISPNALKPHPRNEEFFSNAEGEDYQRLKESIQELGVLTPLRVSSDMTIVSGHQRWRAAKELGLESVPVEIDEGLKDEDEKLIQLIAANFGRMKNDPIKQGKWLVEYERLRGVRQGSAYQKADRKICGQLTQSDIANELGVGVTTLRNLKNLTTLIPELQDVITEGKITPSTGYLLLSRLSEDEQHHLLEKLPSAQKFTQSQIQQYVDQIHGYEQKVAELSGELNAEKQRADEPVRGMKKASRLVAESEDGERYTEMAEKLQIAQENYRKEHETFAAYRKSQETNDRKHAKEIEMLQAKLEKASEPRIIEKIVEVEKEPEDYQSLKEASKRLKELEQKIYSSSRIEPLEGEARYNVRMEMQMEQDISGFLATFEGWLTSDSCFPTMDPGAKERVTESLNRIEEIAVELRKKLKGSMKGVA